MPVKTASSIKKSTKLKASSSIPTTLVADDDVVQYYRYRVKKLAFNFSDGEYDLDLNQVKDVTLIDNYLDNLFPIFKIDIGVEQSVYQQIIKEKDTLTVTFQLRKFYRLSNESANKQKFATRYAEENFINGTKYYLIMEDDDNDLSSYIHSKEFPDGDEDDPNALYISMELFLFNSSAIKGNRKIVNKIFNYITVTTALTWLLKSAGIKKVLLDRPDNTEKYYFFKIPPLTINNAIRFIDSYYGIHSCGSVIYCSLKYTYVLRFSSNTNAFVSGEIEDIYFIVPSVGSTLTDSYAMLSKKGYTNAYYITVDPSLFEPRAYDDNLQDYIGARDLQFIDAAEGTVNSTRNGNGSSNIEVITSKGENTYYADIYANYANSLKSEIVVTVKDVDVSILEPNKHYHFLFQDTTLSKKYTDTYFLCKKSTQFVKEGSDFVVISELTLRAVNK
jgi:hypothetical protein